MNIAWSAEALGDLASLRAFIAQDDPMAAKRVALQILQSVKLLSDHPSAGRAGRVPGTRELVVPRTPDIVPYRVADNGIQIIRVYHATRRWPDSF
jgi:toxin ParE1/3/4